MSSRAIQSHLLDERIAENKASQEIDLVTWIFDRLPVSAEDQVLELCCGTGGQTLKFLDLLGEAGHIVALDVSKEALQVLASKAGDSNASKLSLVVASLDDLSRTLQKLQFQPPNFDLIFCAYGLYYSSDAEQTLNEACSRLKSGGKVVVVGPFGPNNGPLFDMVRASGVIIPDPVIASSERFMLETVLSWGVKHFESVSVHTLVNRVRWAKPERVLNYWQNTTFYDPLRRSAFETLLQRHFEEHHQFVNEKWVMMVEMSHARA